MWLQIFALLLIAKEASSFVYSCNAVKNKLIEDYLPIPAIYGCVVLQEKMVANFIDFVYLFDEENDVQYSLNYVFKQPGHCMKGAGLWRIRQNKDKVDCTNYELTLLFTSSPPNVVAAYESNNIFSGGELTLVNPEGGIGITTTCQKGTISVYEGIGNDENEDLILQVKEDQCFKQNHYFAYDTVMTIRKSDNADISYTVTTDSDYYTVAIGQPATLMATGLSDDMINTRLTDLNAQFSWITNSGSSLDVNGFIQFDSGSPAWLGFVAVNANGINSASSFSMSSDLSFSLDDVVALQVHYTTTYLKPEDVWKNNDTFVITITSRDKTDSTLPPPSTSTTTKATVSSSTRGASDNTDATSTTTPLATTTTTVRTPVSESSSYCACGLDEDGLAGDWSRRIWLDIVIIIDTSMAMGRDGVDEASAIVESFISSMNLDSSDANNKMYSRVGLIGLSNTVEILYNLNMTSDSEVELTPSKFYEVDFTFGFQTALQMFREGRYMDNYRSMAKQVIYVVTNSAPNMNMNGVNEFKASGGTIIVSDFIEEGQVPEDALMNLASPGFFFTRLTNDYNYNLKLFCDINCFCNPGLHPFSDSTKSPYQSANRGCYHVGAVGVTYNSAVKICEMEDAQLVSIHDDEKQFFLTGLISTVGIRLKYWIGLENVDNRWIWIDNSTVPYDNWDTSDDQPNTADNKYMCTYAAQTVGFTTEWYAANCAAGNYYICESAPCSTEKYCDY